MFEFVKDGKTNWPYIRQILYVCLFVWVVGVRLAGINPFDDFGENKDPTLGTLIDFLALYALYIFSWHVMWPLRPKVG